jgi:hypothetical protein
VQLLLDGGAWEEGPPCGHLVVDAAHTPAGAKGTEASGRGSCPAKVTAAVTSQSHYSPSLGASWGPRKAWLLPFTLRDLGLHCPAGRERSRHPFSWEEIWGVGNLALTSSRNLNASFKSLGWLSFYPKSYSC